MLWNRARRPQHAGDHRHQDDDGALRAAYERGRRDERARRKRHPVLMSLTFLAAAVGATVIALAGLEGSFARGGSVVDHNLAVAADRAAGEATEAMDRARHIDPATALEG